MSIGDVYIKPQMFIGDGAKIVRDAFELAREKAPTIIFIGMFFIQLPCLTNNNHTPLT